MPQAGAELSINLSAVVYQENGTWLGHCLELDIVAEGTDADDALDALVSLCDFQIKVALDEGDLESVFRPAPPETWRMFSAARRRVLAERTRSGGKTPFKAPVDRFEARQLTVA